mgnify:CR=1 FL=1
MAGHPVAQGKRHLQHLGQPLGAARQAQRRAVPVAVAESVGEEALRAGFRADQAVLVLFGDPDAFGDISAGRFFRVVERHDEALRPFSTFLDGTSARCGRIRDSQRDFLFHQDANEIGSAALVPLGAGAEIGFLAVGRTDSDRFHPGMSIDFLTRVGELVSEAL